MHRPVVERDVEPLGVGIAGVDLLQEAPQRRYRPMRPLLAVELAVELAGRDVETARHPPHGIRPPALLGVRRVGASGHVGVTDAGTAVEGHLILVEQDDPARFGHCPCPDIANRRQFGGVEGVGGMERAPSALVAQLAAT